MSASDKELEKQLTEGGKKLIDPPSSVEELLPLLDKVERCLSEVEQSPPDSMQNVLSPLMKALVSDKLFKHSDTDVSVAVAACISEITRITAPDAPYDDDQMREVFQLIVSSFENLTDISSRSYSKRASILDTVAKVRSCVVMLDLECDALIIEMFQHFLKAIRDHHPDNVFSSMETIMTLVLEESEEISPELLSPILDYVRKDNEVPQISQKLAEQVLKSSANKLKPYLTDAMKSLGHSLNEYCGVVASICEGASGALKQNESVANEKDDIQDNLAKEVAEEDKSTVAQVVKPEQADAPKEESLKPEVSNGVAQITENDSSADIDSTKKQDDTNVKDEPEQPDKLGEIEMENAGDEKETDVGNEQDQQSKEKEKQSSSLKQEELSKASDVEEETESRAPPDIKDGGRCTPSSPSDSYANVKASDAQALPSKSLADETPKITSPSQSESLPDDNRSTKGNQKKKESSTKESKSSADSSAKVAPEEPSSLEAKPTKRSGKKVASSSKTKASTKKSTSGTKTAKHSGKKAVESDDVQASSKPKEEKKKQGLGKATDEMEQSHISSDDEKPTPKSSKDEQPMEETSKTNAKRKRNLGKEKASEDKEFGENLVGAKVKVWWPKDRKYYQGVVDSYDAAKKKHLVLYDDGDQEILNLKREKWEFIEDESESNDADEKGDRTGHDETSTIPQKKKAKTGNEQSAKQTKAETSTKKGAASSKSKVATKSGKISEDERTKNTNKEISKAEDDSSDEMSEDEEKSKTSGGKPAKSVSNKSKKEETGTTPKSGKTKDDTETGGTKAASKKKEERSKSSSKSKPESAKSSSSVKGKTGKGAGKSNNNGSGKPKSASASKAEESNGESDTEDTPKAPETSSSKGKSPSSAKSQGKSSKKRKR